MVSKRLPSLSYFKSFPPRLVQIPPEREGARTGRRVPPPSASTALNRCPSNTAHPPVVAVQTSPENVVQIFVSIPAGTPSALPNSVTSDPRTRVTRPASELPTQIEPSFPSTKEDAQLSMLERGLLGITMLTAPSCMRAMPPRSIATQIPPSLATMTGLARELETPGLFSSSVCTNRFPSNRAKPPRVVIQR